LTENIGLQQILGLIEDSNLEYDFLRNECQRRGVGFIGLDEYRLFRQRVISGEHMERVLRVLQKRRFIKIDNDNIFPLRDFINRGRHLNDEDRTFANHLLNEFGNIDAI
jgi:hypothetical protein